MEKLKELVSVFLKDETDYLELTKAVEDLNKLVIESSGLNLQDTKNRENIHADTGMALGTTWAAMCIKDIIRTKQFVKGVFEAIENARRNKSGTVNILYAGTGPFATLLLPALASYSPEEIQCVLLEINTKSFLVMQQLIENLGFKAHVRQFVNEDATTYRIHKDHDIDILVSETMQRALEHEQQVPIMMHLIPQLKPEALIIPENITLELGLMDIGQFLSQRASAHEESYHKLGVFYELTKEAVLKWNSECKKLDGVFHFPKATFKISNKSASKFRELVVRTGITVFGNTKILINESGLTTPLILDALPKGNEDLSITIHYKVDKKPGLVYELTKLPTS